MDVNSALEYELRWNFADLRYDQVLKGSMYRQEHMPLAPKFSQISLGGLGGRREVSPFEVYTPSESDDEVISNDVNDKVISMTFILKRTKIILLFEVCSLFNQ